MNRRNALMTTLRRQNYFQRVRGMFGSNVIAYWQLNETTGVTAFDSSGNGRNGAYRNTAGVLNGVTLGQTGIGDGKTSVAFDGVNGYCNIYSAGLASAFNGAEGSVLFWLKGATGVFSDGVLRRIFDLRSDINNRVLAEKTALNVFNLEYIAGGTQRLQAVIPDTTNWMSLAITWSVAANEVKFYKNGAQVGSTVVPPTWSGSLASTLCVLGAGDTTPTQPFPCNMAHFLILNRAATPAEVEKFARNF